MFAKTTIRYSYVCYRDIVRKYGTKHWDYPDVNCPKSL
ncbi:hypothetical protein HMPREF0662_01896 [Prevotella nigrescens F0103]|nr:hypothetical protein HMPREF0662_01896 [Prevotella nigrescens F0103]